MRRALCVAAACIALHAWAAGRELAPRPAGVTPYAANVPQTAFAAGRFLTIWSEEMGTLGRPTRGAFGTGMPFPIPAAGTLVATGDSWALFGFETLTDLDANGEVVRRRAIDLPHSITRAVAWNGTYFFVALRSFPDTPENYDRTEGFLLDRDGNVVRRGIVFDQKAHGFVVAAMEGGFALFTQSTGATRAYRITNDGETTERVLDSGRSDVAATRAPDGSAFVVWTSGVLLKTAVLTAHGELVDLRTLAITDPRVARPLHLMPTGNDYVLLYETTPVHQRVPLATIELYANGSSSAGRVLPQAGHPRGVSAASNGETMFVSYVADGFRIHRVLVDANGEGGAPEVVSVARERHTAPVLAAAGGRLLATWSAVTGTTETLMTRAVDGAPLQRTPQTLLAARDVAWNGAEALTLTFDGKALLATRIDASGTPIGSQRVMAETSWNTRWNEQMAVVWAGDRWLVIAGWQPVMVRTVSAAGVVSVPRALPFPHKPLRNWSASIPSLAATFDGTHVVLAWVEEHVELTQPQHVPHRTVTTYVARVTRDGALVDAAPLALPAAERVSIASDGPEVVLLADTTAYAIDTGAMRVSSSRRVFDWPATSDLAWDGVDYVAALRYAGLQWYAGIVRFDRALRPVGAMRAIATGTPDEVASPSVAALARTAFVAVHEGDVANGVAAKLYREDELPRAPAPPAAPRNVQSRRIPGTSRYEVTWEPSAEGEVESYRVESYRVESFFVEGLPWEHVATVAPGEPLRAISPSPVNRVLAFNAGGASVGPQAKRRAARH